MDIGSAKYRRYVFVCENQKADGSGCGPGGGVTKAQLKQAIAEAGLGVDIRTSSSGCQGACADGPNILLMPEGLCFHHVAATDLPGIVAALRAAVQGTPLPIPPKKTIESP